MTLATEISSWNPFFTTPNLGPELKIGDAAPSSEQIPVPSNKKPFIVVFLRHCGCPFAEKAFKQLRSTAEDNYNDIHFYAVSHSDESATAKWLEAVGGQGKIQMIIDDSRQLYAKWGLGHASLAHVLNPTSLGEVSKLKEEEGIDMRPTESGSRWQEGGSFAVDENGKIIWGGKSESAEDIGDFQEAVRKLLPSRAAH
eukprot:TRINITY_DN1167_c0_g1_i2.p1 TRINITY_DN1167_c0_g1~~TRINITY_DN1167_c0_g1_i2.p1  ORF type:complete len:198 (-),score=54.86 TRINITY_DN1167_c0_g1_i2:199-792(-)